jgi:hypothetical protein
MRYPSYVLPGLILERYVEVRTGPPRRPLARTGISRIRGRSSVITRQDAALRAELILEYPAGDPENGWLLDVFSQGWLVCWRGRDPCLFSMVIERATGLVRYFTRTPPQRILNDYDAVRDHGHPDHRWAAD